MIYLTLALYLLGALVWRNLFTSRDYLPSARWAMGLLWPFISAYGVVALIAKCGPGEVFWK